MSRANPRAFRRTARRASDLVEAGLVDPAQAEEVSALGETFALAVTPEMIELMEPGDPADPIFRQFIPTSEEAYVRPEERADPIGDDPFTPLKGITHRYPDRVLLKPVHVCPVYCRFCLRREQVGPGGEALSPQELEEALAYVRSRPEIWEVILSGGDPMILSPRRLGEIVRQLDAIPHVDVVRLHTRVPVVSPGRVTPELVAALRTDTPVYVVLHCNHAREMTPEARAACARLVDAGIPMLSQTVLLKGVNDDRKSLEELFRTLVKNRVKPYYLHHGDLARGTGHLRTTIADGQRLVRELRGHVSGLCQPTYVLDVPGGHGKTPIGPAELEGDEEGGYVVRDYRGKTHAYPPKDPTR